MSSPPFETVYTTFEVPLLRDAYIAITACNLWEWMKTYSPPEATGFMFGRHPNLEKILNTMAYSGHSGASYGWTMRIMEDIAKHGWEAHKNQVRRARSTKRLEQWAATVRNPPCQEGKHMAF